MEFSRCARAREPTCREHRCDRPNKAGRTDLSKLNSALADRLTPHLERQQSEEISVGDEVDIHLGELWHRTILSKLNSALAGRIAEAM